jgi:Domain of unknown function (DUF362)
VLLFAPLARSQTPHNFAPTNATDARVVIVENEAATDDFVPKLDIVQAMVNRAITNLTGKTTVVAAWGSLVSTNDVVGLKVLSSPGPNSGTRKDVVAAIIVGLLATGLPPTHIVVWDRHEIELRMAGYYELQRHFGIKVMGSVEAGYDEKIFYDTPLMGTLTYGDLEFGKSGTGIGRKSYVSKLVTQNITKMINVTPMLHHNIAGVSGNLFSLSMGSVDNTGRFENSPSELARAIPEVYALPILGDRVVLNVVDALICQYQGEKEGLLHYSTVLNQLRFSRDPVALDVLSLQEINHQRELSEVPIGKIDTDIYSNASLLEIGVSDPNRIKVEKLH